MKKTRFILIALAVAFSLSSFQIKAAKSAVRERFDASLDRFKKCLKFKCTRAEGLKAARDLAVTAAAVIVAAYVAGRTLQDVGRGMARRGFYETGPRVYRTGAALASPLQGVGSAAIDPVAKTYRSLTK